MTKSPSEVGLKHGFRSGLEEKVADQIKRAGLAVTYEDPESVIRYSKPERKARYTPDFILPNGIIVETKGRFLTDDRQKHLLIKAQHPDKDVRFIFSNSKARISKTSATTYAAWCDKHGFLYHDKTIPKTWIEE